jgi:peptidyl-prolyl cis-trans isomerase B (cyclophilin B)
LRLETSCGTIDIELAVADAPVTTNSVAFLAREGFYDGLTFHRLVPGFVIQGGDPLGDGTGGSGYRVEEVPPDDLRYAPGVVAMAKAGHEPPGTSGSQFFIVSGEDAEVLPADYAYVGDVVAGMDVVEEIEGIGTGEEAPPEAVYIEQATIVER